MEKFKSKRNLLISLLYIIVSFGVLNIFGMWELYYDSNTKTQLFIHVLIIIYVVVFILLNYQSYKITDEIIDINKKIKKLQNKNYESIAKIISKSPKINKMFKIYKKSLRPIRYESDSGEAKVKYFATSSVEEVINEKTVYGGNLSYKTINFSPQVLTGIGIFGTFLGIVKGLSGLEEKISSSNMQEAINQLLSGVSISFTSSLFGISLSILLALFIKIFFDINGKFLDEFIYNIDSNINMSSSEEGLKPLEKELNRQSASIEKLATDISEEIGNRFDAAIDKSIKDMNESIEGLVTEMQSTITNSLTTDLKPILEHMVESVDVVIENQNNSSEEFIKSAMERMGDVVSQGANQEIEHLKTTMETMTNKISNYMGSFEQSLNSVKDISESQIDLMKSTNESSTKMNNTAESLESLEISMNQILDSFSTVNANNHKSIEGLNEVVENINGNSESQKDIIKEFSNVYEKMDKVSMTQQRILESLNSSTKGILIGIKDSESYMNQINRNIEKYNKSFDSLNNKHLNITTNLNNQYQKLMKELNTTVNTLNSMNKGLLLSFDESSNTFNQASSNMKNASGQLLSLVEPINNFSKAEKESHELWRSYESSFNKLNGEITEGVDNYTAKLNKNVKDVFETYDSEISSALNKLTQMVQVIGDFVEDLEGTLSKVTNEIG